MEELSEPKYKRKPSRKSEPKKIRREGYKVTRCEIIAEIGINHQGDMNIAKSLIEAAKGCGADVAKFQLYDPKKRLHPSDFSPEDWSVILESELDYYDTRLLRVTCNHMGIEFMASAFDEERLGWLEEQLVRRHKVASRSLYDYSYVEAVKATGKPFFVSFGMVDEEVERLEATMRRLNEGVGPGGFYPMYCVSEYPTPIERLDLHRNSFDKGWYGFSDHTVGITAACAAIVLGARAIEKHFTYDKGAVGPDHCCSMDREELKALCEFRDDFFKLMR